MRLLFITGTRIGDAVLSTGLLGRLIDENPGIKVTIAIGRLSAPLFPAVPGLEEIIRIDKQSYDRHWIKLWRRTVLKRWDIVVDLRGSATSYLLWTRRRLVIGKRRPGRHRVEELGEIIDAQAGQTRPPEAPRVWLSDKAKARAEALLPAGPPILAVAPVASWIGKQWPAERFAELVTRLTGEGGILPGARIAVFAAPQEREQAGPVLAAAGGAGVDLVDCGDLLDVAACLSRATFFVGNDSGLMHLAAASGIATLGLFGPSPEQRYRPWGAKAAFVRTPESYEVLAARPGFGPDARISYMENLTVDAVEQAAQALWSRLQGDL